MRLRIIIAIFLLAVGGLTIAATKVGDLPAVVGAPAGTDELYIINGGVSKKVTVDNLGAAIAAGGGDSITVDTVAVVDPDFASSGDIDFVDTANTITANINAGAVDATAMGADSVGESELIEAMNFIATGGWNFSTGTLELPNSITLPGTCAVGETYFDSDATAGQNQYGCTAVNTWTLQGDGGGSPPADSINYVELDYSDSLAGNPAMLADECAFVSTITGGGILCEGSTANTNEQLYKFPDVDGADTTEYIVVADNANVSPVEAGYLDGVTSAIQTQLNAKEGTLTNEAGLYAALSDVTNFLQTGDALAGADIANDSINATKIASDSINLDELDDGADTPVAGEALFVATGATDVEYKFIQEHICVAFGDETTAITTGTAKFTFRMPYAFTLTAIRGSLTTVSSSGSPIFDVNETGTSIMTTNKILIDVSEKTSTTAVTAPTLTDTALADDAEITVDIDTAGTGAAGPKLCLIGHQ